MLDLEGRIRSASTGAAALFGLTVAQIEDMRCDELLESPNAGVLRALLASMPESETARVAARLRTHTDDLLDADLHICRLPGAARAGAPYVIGIEVKGVAPRRSGGIVDAAEHAAVVHDAVLVLREGKIRRAGGPAGHLVGLPGERLVGMSIKNLIAAEDLLPVIEILGAVESGETETAEFGLRLLRAGSQEPLEVAARARGIASGEGRGPREVLIGLRDISRDLRATRGAADRIARLDAALGATADGVLVLGPAAAGSRVMLASAAFCALYAMDATSFVGKPFQDLWTHMRPLHAYPEDDERLLTALLADESALRVDLITLAQPADRVLERFTCPLRDETGGTLGRICTFRDVTARTRAEAAMRLEAEQARHAREELARLHDDLRLANEGLERRMAELGRLNKDLKVLDEMKSSLLANVSHELQTPLVSIKGFTEMILKGSLGAVTPEQARGLEVALRNINRLIGMIDNLLAFARRAGEIAPLQLSSFPLGPLAEEAVDLVREKARDRRIALRLVMPPGDLMVKADRDKVLQVLLNLLTNAIRYNRDGGEVSLEAERGRRGVARVEVRDTGIGMSRAVQERIFDRHFQAGQPGAEGSGIGLSIVRDILAQHGGAIRVASEEGKGSSFWFTLPLEKSGRPHRHAARAEAPARRAGVAEET